jgi:hypothetical protein
VTAIAGTGIVRPREWSSDMPTNKVNELVRRYLIGARADRDEAFDGLVGCCWIAKKNMYAIAQGEEGVFSATQNFIQTTLEEILEEYEKLPAKKVAEMADAGKFRWVARQVRNRLRDHVRETYKQLRVSPAPKPSLEPTSYDFKLAAEKIRAHRPKIVFALGQKLFDTLLAAVDNPRAGANRRERKGHLTRVIAKSQRISFQQARWRKRMLLAAIMESANPKFVAIRSAGWFRWLFDLCPENGKTFVS